jgi:hypothetical protein
MPRKKAPDSVSNYFNFEVESAIVKYNTSTSHTEKEILFRLIYPALHKIAEVMYNKIKPTYVQIQPLDFQMDCTAFLADKLHFIREGKGKAFSYMTVTARNFYIGANMKAYSKLNKHVTLDYVNDGWDIKDTINEDKDNQETTENLLKAFCDYLETYKLELTKGRAKKALPILNEIIRMIREIDNIEDFNRRNIMNDLTKVDGLTIDRHYITAIFNKFQAHYIQFKKYWLKYGTQMPYLDKQDLTEEEIVYCIENYKEKNWEFGPTKLAKKFGVDEYVIRRALYNAGLCTI